MSSPTLEAITTVRNVLSEAVIIDREREAFAADRLSRIERYGKRRNPGSRVRPRGDFITSVGFPDIQAQHKASLAAAEAGEQRSQLRSTRTIILQEIKTLKAQWKEEIESRATRGLTRLTWNQWLDETDIRPRFLALETQRKEHNDILSQRPKRAFSDAQEEARRAPRPIIAMDQSAWPDSDDEVEFQGIGPSQDNDDDIDLIGFNDLGGDDLPDVESPLGMSHVNGKMSCM
ncbi:hypothetical protein EDB81DRAFT_670995 [Dactylonectria macrodidyma]|uniref:Uncharacterized protein n=1 Tax=Dactylonectria macrodidyma TaxID=307937 RepID=A0A9P9D2U0_9HYPO|nr:hypothetical protein EDB81DRAFT_670995 [Dactylonectria macrodidyma]